MSAKDSNISKQAKMINKAKPKGKSKKGRVIIRNLSFKVTEEVLRKNFSEFGEISEIIIPKKPDGKMRGFGFVQFVKTASAIKAINALNAKEILGRPVAIDFAIPKDKFNEVRAERSNLEQKNNLNENHASAESKGSSGNGNCSDEEEEHSSKNRKKKPSKSNKDSDSSSSDEADCSDEKIKIPRLRLSSGSELDSSSDDDPPGQKINHSSSSGSDNHSESESDNDVEDEGYQTIKRKLTYTDSDGSDGEEEGHSNKKKRKKLAGLHSGNNREVQKRTKRPSDVSEGRTLFIRNLSFDTTAEELKEAMSKYGDIKYCLLCKDPLTEYPKGTAFVQFSNKEDAEKCLENSNSKDDKIVLGGRMLNVALALTHDDIKKQKEERIKKGKDNRNLKLETEGLIRPGSDAAKGVSQADLTKRLQLEKFKKKLLKNLNYFISPVRLCVHNIPLHFDDKKLWKLFLKAAGSGAVITEARIMRNLKNVDEKGVGLSKGFGFVCFSKHEHALQALRKLNNNPDIFSPHKRPIVEFSVENRSILNAKKRQMERQSRRPFQPKKTGDDLAVDSHKMEGRKQKFLGNRKKKFSKPFKPKKIGNQQLNIANKLKPQKGKFQNNTKKKGKKKKAFRDDGKKRKNLKE